MSQPGIVTLSNEAIGLLLAIVQAACVLVDLKIPINSPRSEGTSSNCCFDQPLVQTPYTEFTMPLKSLLTPVCSQSLN